MAELKNMTVQALRDLARKALGRGHSKLKTKKELIDALQAAERKVAGAAEKAATAANRVLEATERAARATTRMVETMTGRKGGKAREPAKREQARKAAARKAAPGSARAKATQAAREAARAVRDVAQAAKAGARRVREAVRCEPTPDPEGYMVARVAGEEVARGAPRPMTESALEAERGTRPRRSARAAEPEPAVGAYDEDLGELPWSYADDVLMALPRDPTTLFLYWDHAQATVHEAWKDLEGGRTQLWIFAREGDGSWTHTRTVDFALESRSYYVHDLEPGRVYRAEIHVVDRSGRDRLLPRTSNEMMLPAVGPSPVIDDRFMRILWSEPLQRIVRGAHAGAPFPEDMRAQLARLSDWSRFGGRVWGGSAGGMGGRPSSPVSAPSSSPAFPWGRPDGEGR